MNFVIALIAGFIFGIGLIISGMTDPMKVKGFLDLAGAWNPSLALVMVGAIAVGVIGFAIAKRRAADAKTSWSGAPIEIPTNNRIDARLIAGGLLFGAGWGIAGLCPGPAIVVAASGATPVIAFVVAMLAGIAMHDLLMPKAPQSRE
jgi:uncharacterized protein